MKYRALVVEDDPAIVHLATDALVSMGHEFDVAASQQEALAWLAQKSYSYILLDIQIPTQVQNGIGRVQNTENMLETIVESSDEDTPPIILLSDYSVDGLDETVKVMRLAMSLGRKGAMDVIRKPFPTAGRTLDRVIKKVLRIRRATRKEQAAPAVTIPLPQSSPAVSSTPAPSAPQPSSSASTSPSAPASSSPVPDPIALTEMQLTILQGMAKWPHQTLVLDDIIAAGGYGKHATRQCIGQLEKIGFIHRPQGARKGMAVTQVGRDFVTRALAS